MKSYFLEDSRQGCVKVKGMPNCHSFWVEAKIEDNRDDKDFIVKWAFFLSDLGISEAAINSETQVNLVSLNGEIIRSGPIIHSFLISKKRFRDGFPDTRDSNTKVKIQMLSNSWRARQSGEEIWVKQIVLKLILFVH